MIDPNEPCPTCDKRIGNHLLVEWMVCTGKQWVRLVPMKKNESGQVNAFSLLWFIVAVVILLAILRAFGLI